MKKLEGWNSSLILANPDRVADGGLQLLWKNTRFGRIGYVSKGPVLPSEGPQEVHAILIKLREGISSLGLRAVILQPPDESQISESDLLKCQFSRRPVSFVARATAVVDVSGGPESIENRMHSKARQQVRAARKRGVSIVMGGRADLQQFFHLMRWSCLRQNVKPNPSKPELLEALWDAFSPRVLLGLASCRGELVAGLLMIGHGSRMTFWKKGWNSQESKSYANCLLNVEALGWAAAQGYTTVDFAALDPSIAGTLLVGGKLTDSQRSSRDIFNLRLGAGPKLLPPARLLIVNRTIRRLFSFCSRWRLVEQALTRRVGGG